jgi:hypothetical protein
MRKQSDAGLNGWEKRRLRLARENAYLDARRPDSQRIAKSYGAWCWRLKIPLVWYERESPRSRYGRVSLDLFTTPNILTTAGQGAMKEIPSSLKTPALAKVSPNDATWDHVPVRKLEEFAKAAFRTALKPNHYRPNRAKLLRMESAKPGKLIRMMPRKEALA